MRKSAKRSRHGADVVRAGGHFVPLVYDTYGTMGEEAEAWVRGLIAVATIEQPEWMLACGAGETEMMEWDRWARAQLGADWSRRSEEDECCPSEGQRSDHFERSGSCAIGERGESVRTHELE